MKTFILFYFVFVAWMMRDLEAQELNRSCKFSIEEGYENKGKGIDQKEGVWNTLTPSPWSVVENEGGVETDTPWSLAIWREAPIIGILGKPITFKVTFTILGANSLLKGSPTTFLSLGFTSRTNVESVIKGPSHFVYVSSIDSQILIRDSQNLPFPKGKNPRVNLEDLENQTFTVEYQLTLGPTAKETLVSTAFLDDSNQPKSAPAFQNGVEEDLFNDLTKTGVFPFFGSAALGSGIKGVRIKEVSVSLSPE